MRSCANRRAKCEAQLGKWKYALHLLLPFLYPGSPANIWSYVDCTGHLSDTADSDDFITASNSCIVEEVRDSS